VSSGLWAWQTCSDEQREMLEYVMYCNNDIRSLKIDKPQLEALKWYSKIYRNMILA